EDALPGADLRDRRHAQRHRPGQGLEEGLPSPPAARDRLPLVTDPVVLPCHESFLLTIRRPVREMPATSLHRPTAHGTSRQVPFLSHAGVSLRYDRAGTG